MISQDDRQWSELSLPGVLPEPIPQTCKSGINVVVAAGDGSRASYGPCRQPAVIRLLLADLLSVAHGEDLLASVAPRCARRLIADWYGNARVDRLYRHICYEKALDLLPEDREDMDSAETTIRRAFRAVYGEASPARQSALDGQRVAARTAPVAMASGTASHGAPRASDVQGRRYRDAGWSLTYPDSMFLERSGAQLRVTVFEVTVASFAPQTAVVSGRSGDTAWIRVDRPLDAHGAFPSDGVAFRIMRREGGPAPNLGLPETRFPLRLASFEPSQAYPGTEPPSLERTVVAAGRTYLAQAWIGESASPELRASLERVISTLSFPGLRPGTLVGEGFTVIRLHGRYPLGSFTRIRAQGQPFYLVHAPSGFYGVGWREQTLARGYKSSCELMLDLRRREFFCTNLRARWDRVGRVLVRPRGASRGDPLNLALAKVAWDGHVLLHAGTARFADRRLAHELWPGWTRASGG